MKWAAYSLVCIVIDCYCNVTIIIAYCRPLGVIAVKSGAGATAAGNNKSG
jgi:hypothetical protein